MKKLQEHTLKERLDLACLMIKEQIIEQRSKLH